MRRTLHSLVAIAAIATALGACAADDEANADAGLGAGGATGGSAAGGAIGGDASGGQPAGGQASGGGGGTPAGGAAPPPDAALPDAFVETCPAEVLAEVVELAAHPDGEGFRYEGDTSAAMNRTSSPCGGGDAPEVIHRFVAPVAGRWRFDTESTANRWDTIVSLRDLCLDANSVTCNDDGAYPPLSQFDANLEAGQALFVVVDGHTGGPNPDRGAYTLSVTRR